jgi:hypothetical protein
MATPIDYVDLDDLKNTISADGTTFLDADGERAITSASRAIDTATNRFFYADAEADQERFYTPDRALTLEIDDLIELTAVELDLNGDGTFETAWTETADFFLEPFNAEANSVPWERVKVRKACGKRLPLVERSVRVTGRFGWAEVPPEIVEATGILATKLIRRAREAPFGILAVALETGTAIRLARTDPDIATLIDAFTREVFLV